MTIIFTVFCLTVKLVEYSIDKLGKENILHFFSLNGIDITAAKGLIKYCLKGGRILNYNTSHFLGL